MTIMLNGLLVLIGIAGLLWIYHLIQYYRTSSIDSVRGYEVEKHYTKAISRATLSAVLIAVYVLILAFTK